MCYDDKTDNTWSKEDESILEAIGDQELVLCRRCVRFFNVISYEILDGLNIYEGPKDPPKIKGNKVGGGQFTEIFSIKVGKLIYIPYLWGQKGIY